MKILVIVARGLQAGAVGCYGSQWIDTPALNDLAADGVVFDQHFADAASPEGARRAWRTGCYRLPAPSPTSAPAEPANDLLALLDQHNIPTVLILDESQPSPAGSDQGWQTVERVTPDDPDDTPLEATVSAVETALEELGEQPRWLLWVELATLLPPWEVPEEFQGPYFREEPAEEELEEDEEDEDEDEEDEEKDEDEESEPLTPLNEPEPGQVDPGDDTLFLRLQSSYASAVSYLDAGVGQLLEVLGDKELLDQTLIVLLSDCGQALGEHGIVGPVRPSLHEEIVHLPLLIRLPGGAEAGRRVVALTQTVDLAPTLAEFFGLGLPGHGQSLLPLLHGQADKVRDYACAGSEVGGGIEWCLRTPAWALLLPVQPHPEDANRSAQLYLKPDDRCEVNNVLQQHQEWAELLEQTLRAFVEATRQQGPFQPPPLPDEDAEPVAPV